MSGTAGEKKGDYSGGRPSGRRAPPAGWAVAAGSPRRGDRPHGLALALFLRLGPRLDTRPLLASWGLMGLGLAISVDRVGRPRESNRIQSNPLRV